MKFLKQTEFIKTIEDAGEAIHHLAHHEGAEYRGFAAVSGYLAVALMTLGHAAHLPELMHHEDRRHIVRVGEALVARTMVLEPAEVINPPERSETPHSRYQLDDGEDSQATMTP